MDEWTGLTTAEATKRLAEQGRNVLPETRFSLLKLIWRQLKGIFNLLLLAAAVVTFLLGEPVDAAFIIFFIVLGTSLNVFQEYKANAAAASLKKFLVNRITVRREGREQELDTAELVPGDIIRLKPGDIVPADAVVRQTRDLMADETTFTGESIPVAKSAAAKGDTPSASNLLLQGVVIVRGDALAEIIATGTSTRLAAISAAASDVQQESELTKGIDRISKFILRVTLITLTFVVLANLLINRGETDFPTLLIFAIALAVSVIPEALPLVLTFSLSRGALRFAKQGVIVKRLSSVMDLGGVDLLCTDKTGTITENRLFLVESKPAPDSKFDPLLLARLAAHDLDKENPEPFDRAINAAINDDLARQLADFKVLEEEAFDPAQRSNGALVQTADGSTLHIRRGSPEYFTGQALAGTGSLNGWLLEEERQGHRILGLSYRENGEPRFAGYVSFIDRLKSTTLETVKAARELHVQITMITGDALLVADAVGREAGLVTNPEEVTETAAFLALPQQEQAEKAGGIRVFARTTPEQKLQLIELLKQQYTVGFLGEGINDAPALKAAHVSLVVQSAADVARETADIVLLDSDLRVIVNGIRAGRETHANTLKYIRATLVANFGHFYAVAIGSIFINFLPMLPKQLLMLNLLSDFPMLAIAFDHVAKSEIERPQTYDFRALYITFLTLGFVSTVFDLICFGLFFRISPAVLQTNWFIASVTMELLLIFSIRSMLNVEKAGWPAPLIIILSGAAMLLALALPIVPWTARFFEFQTPQSYHLALILGLAALYLVVTELVKRPLAQYLREANKTQA
ncbi:MAG: HAD-IC family P-type ATPase [Candidatus Cloacimonetes bacterium]|nr:HAD-IC family P-type ATPase [Candidatus Cloacimonadota bacterium]